MYQQSLGHCVLLLLIISLPNKSEENAPELLYDSSIEQHDNTTYFLSPKNQSVQTFRKAFRENFTGNNIWEDSTNTSREEFDKEEDEFVQSNVTKNGEDQVSANETRIPDRVIPTKLKDGIYFKILSRDSSAENKNHDFQSCCPFGHRLCLKEEKCIVDENFIFPQTHKIDKDVNFSVNLVWTQEPPLRLCNNEYSPYMIDPVIFPYNEYYFRDGEQVYFPHKDIAVPLEHFCVAAVNQRGFDLIICKNITQDTPTVMAIIVSSVFLLITFVVYCVRELQNMHAYLLRAYIASMLVWNAIFVVYLQVQDTMDYAFCASLSFMYHFAIYLILLWQNVTCFDIWWTFRGFRRLHKKEKKPNRLRKTFVFYSLYVWGVSFVVIIFTIIMDSVPNIPNHLIKPNMCKLTVDPPMFWLITLEARMIYFYLPLGITWICNTCLFVWTTVKIMYDKKRINCQIRDSESRRHHDCNKERLWMYLKLCVAMSINWIPISLTLELTWIFYKSNYILLSVANSIISLNGIIIFIMFVCTKKVIRLLIKRFGWSGENSLCHF